MPDNKSEDFFSFESIVNETTNEILAEVEEEVDIITFCEHPFYLDQPLHGVQRFILKVYYGLTLDDEDPYLLIRSFPFDEEGKRFTEVEYTHFLIQQGRTNLLEPGNFKRSAELLLACGRRSGKTFIASIISSYEAYKLIVKGDPQKYYKLPQGEEIRIINVASTGDQALILAKATQNRILNSKWFIPYVEGKTTSEIRLRTKRDIELIKEEVKNHGKPLDAHTSIKIEAMSCTGRGIRGGTIIVGILDEVAHFVDNSGNRSGNTIYEALTPSIATFGMDGKILCLSSPYTKGGIFYDLYLDSKGKTDDPDDNGDQNKRMFQIPTWEMNETITFEYLNSEKRRNPESFPTEFGAEFSSTILGFFKFPEKIDVCITRESENTGPTGKWQHYIAIDPSANDNGYALAMVHVEIREKVKTDPQGREYKIKQPIVVLDRWKVWSIHDPEFVGMTFIDEEIIQEYLNGIFGKFVIQKIVYDHFDSTQCVVKLQKKGYDAEKRNFTSAYQMKIWPKFRNLIYEERVDLFQHDLGIAELKALQEIKTGKRRFKVEAPKQGEIVTDDLADVLAHACYVATENEINKNTAQVIGTSKGYAYPSSGKSSVTRSAYKMKLRRNKTMSNLDKARAMGRRV